MTASALNVRAQKRIDTMVHEMNYAVDASEDIETGYYSLRQIPDAHRRAAQRAESLALKCELNKITNAPAADVKEDHRRMVTHSKLTGWKYVLSSTNAKHCNYSYRSIADRNRPLHRA